MLLLKPHMCWVALSFLQRCFFFSLTFSFEQHLNKGHTQYKDLFLFISFFKNLFSSPEISVSLGYEEATTGEKCVSIPLKKTSVTPSTQEKQTFWSVLFSVFLFSSFILYPKQQGVILFFYFIIFLSLGVRKAQVHGQTWVSIKKGFLNLWNYVQHVSYINIYLKYKSILLLLDFGFFYI